MSEFYSKILKAKETGRPYIIAELGSNYKSDLDLLTAVNLAKNCGADAIKYQYLDESELYGPNSHINSAFPLSQIKEKCDAAGIDFLCSSFSPEGLKQLDKFVPAHKIASSEMAHIRLLEAAAATGKPIILSTGGYFLTDIKRSVSYLEQLGAKELIILHCNISYPAKYVDIDKFSNLMSAFQYPLGYSDHTTSIDAIPSAMLSAGIAVIEKHFNPFDHADTPDAGHALNTAEFKAMAQTLKRMPSQYTEENEARLMHVRRIVAIKDIKPGEKLSEGENMGIFRSKKPDANGVSPFYISKLEGRVSLKVFQPGDGISLADVE